MLKKLKYKVIALDLDGTLTNSSKEIPKKTLDSLIKVQEMGVKVVLASGRPTAGMVKLANQLKLDKFGSYVLSYNGARITDWKTKKIIYQKTLPQNVLPDLLEHAVSSKVGIVTYEDSNVIAGTEPNKYMKLEANINGIDINYVENFVDYVDFPVNKCLMAGEHNILLPILDSLKSKYFSQLSIYFSEPYFLEIMPQNVDKANSLSILLDSLGLSKEQLICCGDGYNDISMIEFAGLGVAMENANDTVKKAADYITLSNDNEGILHVVNKFIPIY